MSPSGDARLPTLIPRRTLFGEAVNDQFRMAPDGTQVAFLAPHGTGQGLWVRPIDAPEARLIVANPDRPIAWLRWQRDGRHLLYLQDRGGSENYQLWQVAVDGGAPRPLTPGDRVRTVPLALNHRFPGEALVALNARSPRVFDVHRIDLATATSVVEAENPGDVLIWLADNAFRVRAAVAQVADSYVIRIRAAASTEWRVLDEMPFADDVPRLVAFSPDDQALYAMTSAGANAACLVRYDLQTGARTVVFEDAQHDVERVYVDPASRNPIAVGVLRDRLSWEPLVPGFASDLAALAGVADGDFLIEDASADGRALVVRYQSDTAPDRFYVYDRTASRAWLLSVARPELLAYELAPMQSIAITARDGLRLPAYLTLPLGVEPRTLPTVLYVHGGPWYRDRWGHEPFVQWLANRGYAVLQVNFRGSTGYGKAFVNAGNREWAGAMRTDLLDARDWAIAQGVADPARFAIFGGSFGGYAVLTALAWTPDAFSCGIDLVGPSDLRTFMESIPPYWEPMRKMLAERVGEDSDFLKDQSPLFRASSIRSPLLVAHGANDPRVQQQESDQIVAALRANDVAVRYLVFPDEGHGLAHPENLRRFTALAEQFLYESLGGRMEPAGPDEDCSAQVR